MLDLKLAPDCGKTTYDPTISTLPFDDCDFTNIGVSRFCSFNQKRPLPMTEKFATQVQNEFTSSTEYPFVANLDSSKRVISQQSIYKQLFMNTSTSYDSFDNDIAMVSIVYQETTVIQGPIL